ncbi:MULTISPECIES: histidine kinase [unclassified Mesobacillus]|jgi:two-component system, sensor histidine kinase YesM|uniref:cache domain-containing sensor histidine kinase n=1 Tax=unclassified Mesobacillus TaxID=2675270 RepID=UPI00203BB780|nr:MULTISPECIES: histidine kinase [unclassified Mesobacillus]MCM3123878.1 histidine kinase [Mesobacillus sp. MER 33]MCM3234107.1 histidine kinase [Mesobacillus sp. MER 48]
MFQRLRNLTLKYKLILAFSSFIIIPFLAVGGILSWLYLDSNRNMTLSAASQNNDQIIKNIDTTLNSIFRLTMYPIHDQEIFGILRKDYSKLENPGYERSKDFDRVNAVIQNNILLYSDVIDSVTLYHMKDQSIIGRSNVQYVDYSYLKKGYLNEPYIKEILSKNGEHVTVGVHRDRLTNKKEYVVSVGRAIVDPYTSENIGIILINIDIEKLKQFWSNIRFTEDTEFYLLDKENVIIHSSDKSDIGHHLNTVFKDDIVYKDRQQEQKVDDEDAFVLTSASDLSEWRAVTVIPKSELFQLLNTILKLMFIIIAVGLLLSIMASVYIATGITRPLSILEKKMQQVSEGDLDVRVGLTGGDIGRISTTIDSMLEQIRNLISRIYLEESEKRKHEMLAMQSQIRPHFMYNTINVIKWMAKMQGSSGIEDALSSFSSVIKFTAKTEGDLVTVKEETDFIKDYIQILDLRYFNKFDVKYEIEEDVLEYKTLKFLLQPLVENAIFHGFDEIEEKGVLEIKVYEENDKLIFIVEDNGSGIPDEMMDDSQSSSQKLNSIGIGNIKKRIELNFGKEYGLYLISQKNHGTIAKIELPIMK